MDIEFYSLSNVDCTQLHQWLQLPHVTQYWDDGDRTLEQVNVHYLKSDNVKRYLFFINDEPAGFIQQYIIDENSEYLEFALKNKTNIGIDFFIGNEKYLNQGLAIIILGKFIEACCIDADRIIVDPEARNIKAIHIYQKYGFVKIAEYAQKNKFQHIMAINLRRTSRS